METHKASSSTTFVQADTNTFRDLVQKLTGFPGDSEKLPLALPTRLSCSKVDPMGPRRSLFKLQERRHTTRKLEIKLGVTSHFSSLQTHRVKSPILSPMTPLSSESQFFRSASIESPSSPAVLEEEKAIAEKRFYLHPSPMNTPRGSEAPKLLTLFPLSSPSQRNNQD